MAKHGRIRPPYLFACFAAAVLLGIVVLRNAGLLANEDASLVATMFGGLVAAFLGANAAIWYQREKESEATRKEEVDSINGTMLVLIQRITWLRNAKEQTIDPARNDPFRHINIRPWLVAAPSSDLGVEKLRALLSSGGATVVLRLTHEDVIFNSLVGILKSRNQLHLDFQEQVGKSGFRQGQAITHEQMVEVGLERLLMHLVSSTNNFIKLVDTSLEAHLELADALKRTAFAMYPGMSILAYVELPDSMMD